MLKGLALAALLFIAATFSTSSRAPESEPAPTAQPTVETSVATTAEASRMLQRQPNCFVPNLGQWEHGAHYVARFGAMSVFLHEQGWTFTLMERTESKPTVDTQNERQFGAGIARETDPGPTRGVAVRMTFTDARAAELTPGQRLPGVHHYFLGNDKAKWRSDVPLYAAVRYREIQPGVDVLARGQDGHFEYDLMLQPDAELERVEIAVEGIERMHIDGDGAMVLETVLGPVRMPVPPSWEEGPSGEKSAIACRYVLYGDNRFGFEAPARRPGWALVVDPGLVWSTFLGGTDWDEARALTLDAQGQATVAGWTRSANFPTTPGAFDTTHNGGAYPYNDAFVTRLSPRWFEPGLLDLPRGDGHRAMPSRPRPRRAGPSHRRGTDTASANFPTTSGAFDTTDNGGNLRRLRHPAVARWLEPGLLDLPRRDGLRIRGLCPRPRRSRAQATVAGYYRSTYFPTTIRRVRQDSQRQVFDVLRHPAVARWLDPGLLDLPRGDGRATGHLPSPSTRRAATVAGDHLSSTSRPHPAPSTRPTMAGITAIASSPGCRPTVRAWSTRPSSGGPGDDTGDNALALDAQGRATVAGRNQRSDLLPDHDPAPSTRPGPPTAFYDAFVTRLSPDGSSLVYSTFLGGDGQR